MADETEALMPAWPRGTKWLSIGTIAALLLVTGIWGAKESGVRADQRFRRELARQAIAVAEAFPIEEAKALTFTEADRNLPEFHRISDQLKAYSRATGLRCLYTMALRNGQLYFGPEGLDSDDPLSSPVGTLYEEPSEEDFRVFETAEALVQGPYVDEYGPYIGATAPVIDPLSGRVMLVVGLDADPSVWQAEVRRARLIPLLIPLAGFIILGTGMLLTRYRLHRRMSREKTFHATEALSCAAIMLLLTFGISLLIRQMDKYSRDEVFKSLAQLKANAHANAFLDVHNHLQIMANTFASSDFITRSEFNSFCAKANSSALVRASLWLPEIPTGRIAMFEKSVRAEGISDYRVHPVAETPALTSDKAYPILYAEPMDEEEGQPGYNPYADPDCRMVIDECLHSGYPTAGSLIESGSSPHPMRYIRIFQPAASRQQQGVISLTLDPGRLMGRAVTGTSNLSAGLLEIGNDGRVYTLTSSSPDINADCFDCMSEAQYRIFPLFAFGRTYALLVAPEPQWYKSHPLRN